MGRSGSRVRGGTPERLERFVERSAGMRRCVAGADNVSPLSYEALRKRIADGFEGGAVVAGDDELGKDAAAISSIGSSPSHGRRRTARRARTRRRAAPCRSTTSGPWPTRRTNSSHMGGTYQRSARCRLTRRSVLRPRREDAPRPARGERLSEADRLDATNARQLDLLEQLWRKSWVAVRQLFSGRRLRTSRGFAQGAVGRRISSARARTGAAAVVSPRATPPAFCR